MTVREDQGPPSYRCWVCDNDDLYCVNRERVDGVRCCRLCDGHGIPVTDKGRAFLAAAGLPASSDGIAVLQTIITARRLDAEADA